MTGEIGKGVIEAVFKGMPDDLKRLKDYKEGIDRLIDYFGTDDPTEAVINRLIEELAEKADISVSQSKMFAKHLRSKIQGDCIQVKKETESQNQHGGNKPNRSTKCEFLVCARVTQTYISLRNPIESWTLTGSCDFKCEKTPTDCCDCGSSRQVFVQAAGGSISALGEDCQGATIKAT